MSRPNNESLNFILNKAISGDKRLDIDNVAFLLSLDDRSSIELLHRVARKVRRHHFGNKIFTYGFLYFSTHCRNNCTFCHFRASHTDLERYRKSADEILDAACHMADSGVNLIDLTMGEDPLYYHGPEGMNELVKIVGDIVNKTGLPVMISPGVVPYSQFQGFKDAGAIFYACYQETFNRALFNEIRPRQDFDDRYDSKLMAKQSGMLIEEGLLLGIGDGIEDTAQALMVMDAMDADQVRAMTFVPQQGTPLATRRPGNTQKELITLSVMRLLFPNRLIPASLDVDGLAGLKQRLDAGANVITSIVPPGKGLAGVAHASLDIDDARRTMDSILPILHGCGLRTASTEEFNHWIDQRMTLRQPMVHMKKIA